MQPYQPRLPSDSRFDSHPHGRPVPHEQGVSHERVLTDIDVEALVKGALERNPNEAVRRLSADRAFIRSSLSAEVPVLLPPPAWNLFAELASLPCVQGRPHVVALRKHILKAAKEGVTSKRFADAVGFSKHFLRGASQLAWGDLLKVFDILRLASLDIGALTKAHPRPSPAQENEQNSSAASLFSQISEYRRALKIFPKNHRASLVRALSLGLAGGDIFTLPRALDYYISSLSISEAIKQSVRFNLDSDMPLSRSQFARVKRTVHVLQDLVLFHRRMRARGHFEKFADYGAIEATICDMLRTRSADVSRFLVLAGELACHPGLLAPSTLGSLREHASARRFSGAMRKVSGAVMMGVPFEKLTEDFAQLDHSLKESVCALVNGSLVPAEREFSGLAREQSLIGQLAVIQSELRPRKSSCKRLHGMLNAFLIRGADPTPYIPLLLGYVRDAQRGYCKEEPLPFETFIDSLREALPALNRLRRAGYDLANAGMLAWGLSQIGVEATSSVALLAALVSARGDLKSLALIRAVRGWIADRAVPAGHLATRLRILGSNDQQYWGAISRIIRDKGNTLTMPQRARIAALPIFAPSTVAEELTDLAEKQRLLRTNIQIIVTSPHAQEREQAGLDINLHYHTDTGPYPQYVDLTRSKQLDPSYVRMLNEVYEIYRRSFELHFGFSALTNEAKTTPGTKRSMLAQFSLDCGIRTQILRAGDGNVFPGSGILMSGVRLDRILLPNSVNQQDPYAEYKVAWPWAARELDDLALTKFLFARGLIAITPPAEPRYHLDQCHYSLVVFNEHFHNRHANIAALVPSTILFDALRGCLGTLDPENGLDVPLVAEKISEQAPLGFSQLAAACEIRGLNFLNLGWASNLGGLANAYPPGSAPYFTWEPPLVWEGHTIDGAGHVHKSHIVGRYLQNMTWNMERRLRPMREAHDKVFELATACFNLHDLCRMARSLHKKGMTLVADSGAGSMFSEDFTSEDNPPMGARETRMLRECYSWHHGLTRAGAQRKDFPVLVLAPTLDYWNRVHSPLALDTFNLTLQLQDGEIISLPTNSSGSGKIEANIWRRIVRPHYYWRSDVDLRLLARDLLS